MRLFQEAGFTSDNVFRIQSGRASDGRIAGLDGLRALAIIAVTLFHIFPDTVKGGYLGVSLFFVLTGYLLAYTSETQWLAGRFGLLRYFGKRIVRIYPSLLVVLLTTVGVYHFLAPQVMAHAWPEVLSVVLGFNNWWQIAQSADYFTRIASASPFTHLWFLGIELQFYLAWPFLFLLYTVTYRFIGKAVAVGFFVLLALLASALMPLAYHTGMDITRLYYGTDTRVYALLFGAVLGFCRAGHAKRSAGSVRLALSCLAFSLLIALFGVASAFLDGGMALTYQGGMLGMTLAFCALLYLIASPALPLGSGLDNPLFRWIGKRSYGIFLWQYPVIYLFAQMGWDRLPHAAILEMLSIVLLAVWSDAVADCITRQHIPVRGRRFVLVQCIAFILVTAPGVALMGFGCHGLVVSAATPAPPSDLKDRLAANSAALKEQNEQKAQNEQKDAPAAPALPKEEVPDTSRVNLSGIACIGDSVMLGAAHQLQKVLPDCFIDAEVSRYVGGGIDAARQMMQLGQLGSTVVVALGTNGPIAGAERYEAQTRELLRLLGPNRHIFWVNVYGPHLTWQDTNNAYIEQIAATHPNVTIIDWYGLISQHKEWLVSDGIHPNDDGTAAYANLVHDTVARTLAKAQPEP